jgi:hypothetical protein
MTAPATTIEPLMSLSTGGRQIGLSAAAMRTEQRKGRLHTIKIAGKHYVNYTLLREFIARCQDEPKAQDCISAKVAVPGQPAGLSETDRSKLARDAALTTVAALKKRSRVTS